MKVPFQEFRQNEQALIDNLDEINCLIRLSDSGYVVTLPEEKGNLRFYDRREICQVYAGLY